ncbi:potassium-transporting ATPase subunit KdpC [Tundrisphaera lichenicola]|uniref:potassium-transporting ATPase subunit KdpC n=1 Tax=Tundrisphaera lichenicola TaxID=2029860 RepID=UPI003EB9F77C
MRESLRVSCVVLLLMTILTGLVYPLVVTVLAQLIFPDRANGSLLEIDGKIVGSSLIGQPFSRPGYFWGRPSATASVPYNAASSGGSNLGPLHPDLAKNVRSRIDSIREHDPRLANIPVDLVTASGSGLDPHISPAAAEVQVRRVASARGIDENRLRRLVDRHTEGRQFGLLGEPRVNVLQLNLALDGSLSLEQGAKIERVETSKESERP